MEGAPLRAMPRHSITWQGWRTGQWPSRGHASVVPRLCSRACGARPSTGGKPRWEALRGKPRDGEKGCFLGGARSPRPQVRAGRKPGHVMITGRGEGRFLRRGALCAPVLRGRTQAPLWHGGREVDEGPVAYRGNAQVEPMVSSRACGARPSAGWIIRAGMA